MSDNNKNDFDEREIPTLDDIIDDDSDPESKIENDIVDENSKETDIGEFFDINIDSTDETITELPENEQPAINDDNNELDETTFLEPILIEPIVEAITKKIMPELEKNLKELIKEALEEQLPQQITDSTQEPNNND